MRRTVGCLLAVCATACDGDHPVVVGDAPIDSPPLPLEFDIEVLYGAESAMIQVWTGGTDLPSGCKDENWQFPAIGNCKHETDVLSCLEESCLHVELVGSGVYQETTPDLYGTQFFGLALPLPADLVLRFSGCGHTPFEVPIEQFVPPVPTLEIETTPPDLVLRWTTDIPAASATATLGWELGGATCHVVANEYTFAGAGELETLFLHAGVRTFLPVAVYPTPARDARVWRGAGAGMRLR